VSLPAVTTRIYSSDEVQYFSYLRSIYFDRDVSFENEYRYFYDRGVAHSHGFHETFLERETDVGRRVNYATLGSAILWLPFYTSADLWTRISGAAEPNGLTQPYIASVAYGSALCGFLAVMLSARAARIVLGAHRGAAVLLPAFAVWIGTPLLFYMYVAPPFSHAPSAFAAALFVNVWLHVRQRWTPAGAFVLGLSVALLAMVREQDAFLAIGPLVDFVHAHIRTRSLPNLLAVAAAGLAGTLLAYLPQLFAYTALNGYPGPAAHVSRKMYWTAPWGLSVLVSPEHGFLFWTPLALVALAGLFFVRERIVALALALMALSQVYVAGSVASWSVAGAFGQRRFVCLTVVLVIGLAALWNRARGEQASATTAGPPSKVPRYAVAAVVVLCTWWNVALIAQFATRLMDRQRLEPARNAYHAFVTLPLHGPALAYRYLTDRSSFYGPPPETDR
jgi:hypothetical protein